jgi:hypothetical protein
MRADHYLLPAIPVILLLSSVALVEVLRMGVRGRAVALVVIVVLVGVDARRIAANVSDVRNDARVVATRWIEANVSPKALVVTENYGPALLGAPLLLQLEPALRARVVQAQHGRPVYGIVHLPMTQTAPELSVPFYVPSLYGDADNIVTSSAVRERYERNSVRFGGVIRFYEWIDSSMALVKAFPRADDRGVEIKVYASRGTHPAFGDRSDVPEPPRLPAATVDRNGAMYFERAANYEYFGFSHEAYVCYIRALETQPDNRQIYLHCALGAVRVLVANGQVETAVQVLEQVEAVAPDEDARERVANMRRQLAAGR